MYPDCFVTYVPGLYPRIAYRESNTDTDSLTETDSSTDTDPETSTDTAQL